MVGAGHGMFYRHALSGLGQATELVLRPATVRAGMAGEAAGGGSGDWPTPVEQPGILLCDVAHELEMLVAEATDGNGAIHKIRDLAPHVVLTNLRLPGGGFDYVKTIRTLYPSCPIILLAEFGDHHAKAEALACGVKACLAKPASLVDLQRALIGILDGELEPSL